MQYLASLTQCISDAIISTDLHFNIVSWNEAAETLYGWTADEVMGKPVGEVIATVYPADEMVDLGELLYARGYWRGEVIQRRRDGAPLNILTAVSVVKDSSGNVIGAVTVNRDITESKQAEATLQRSEKRFR